MKTRSGFVAQQCTFSFCLMVHRFVPQKEVTEIEAHLHTIQHICLCLTHSLFPRVKMKLEVEVSHEIQNFHKNETNYLKEIIVKDLPECFQQLKGRCIKCMESHRD